MLTAARWPSSSTNTTFARSPSSTTTAASSVSSMRNRSLPFCVPTIKESIRRGKHQGNAVFNEDPVRRRPLAQRIVPLSSLGTRAPRASGSPIQHLRLSAAKSSRQQGHSSASLPAHPSTVSIATFSASPQRRSPTSSGPINSFQCVPAPSTVSARWTSPPSAT